MSGTSPLPFPASRTLSGWWAQLAPHSPRALGVCHLHLHHVEALVRVAKPVKPDPFTRLLLQALTRDATPAELRRHLHLDPTLIQRALEPLLAEGLATRDPAGIWSLTPAGRQVVQHDSYPKPGQERRQFYFAESDPPGKPRYLNLARPAFPLPPPENWTFNVDHIAQCVQRPADWKRRVGFPTDVQDILRVTEAPAPATAWPRVVVDRPERLTLALTLSPAESGQRLLAFAVTPEGWVLDAETPAVTLGEAWPEVFPEFKDDPGQEAWRQAWRTWCHPRNLIPADVEACRLERVEYRLRVVAPSRLIERLQAARSDALKRETWLLAGPGRTRTAALVELTELGKTG